MKTVVSKGVAARLRSRYETINNPAYSIELRRQNVFEACKLLWYEFRLPRSEIKKKISHNCPDEHWVFEALQEFIDAGYIK